MKTAKTEVNWQAVGALAAVASAVIALLAFTVHAHGAGSSALPPASPSSVAAVPSSTTMPLSSQPDPCDVPVSGTINLFRGVSAQPDDSEPYGKVCYWTATDSITTYTFDLDYSNSQFVPISGSSPTSFPGLSHATEQRHDQYECQIMWPTSFGFILVTASAAPRSQEPINTTDPCLRAQGWIVPLLPSMPT